MPTPGAASPNPRRWLILVVLCMGGQVLFLAATIMYVVLPTLSRELHASASDLQWVIDAYVLAIASLTVTGAGLGDRYGRKGVMLTGLVLAAATSIVASQAANATQLIVCRAASGIGAALAMPCIVAMIADVF